MIAPQLIFRRGHPRFNIFRMKGHGMGFVPTFTIQLRVLVFLPPFFVLGCIIQC